MSKDGSRGGRDLFKVNRITAGCLVVMLASAGGAQAQQQLDTVVVTGIRKGIEDAISVKKNKDSIVESISSEDIGKLPDASVAESIARLPGVTAQRTAGRAQQISIRGMSADFSTALLNGREQVSTGDSRAVEFDQYPSELLAGVDIYKTPDAALVGQGLSGTIDLKTVRPLSFAKRTAAVNARDQRTGEGLPDGQQGEGRRYNASYIDQFFDRKVGVALGWARFTEDGAKTSRFEGWGIAEGTYNGQAGVKAPGGFNAWQDQTVQTRTGAMGTLQVKPNERFEAVLDLFFSEFERDKRTKGFQAPIGFDSGGGYDPGISTVSGATVAGGVMQAGTFNGFKGVVRNDTEYFEDRIRSSGLNVKYKGDVWTTAVDLYGSNAKRGGAIFETTAGLPGNQTLPGAANPGTISWTGFDGSNVGSATYSTSVNYGDRNAIRLTDVMGWGGGVNTPQVGYSKIPNVEDKLQGGRFSMSRDLPEGLFFSSVEAGFNQVDRKKERAYIEGRLIIAGSNGPANPYASAAIPGSEVITIAGVPVVSWDPRGSVGTVYEVAPKLVGDIANKDWKVNEKVSSAYTRLTIDSEIAGIPVRGNAGVQLVHASQESTAFNVDGQACPADVCPTRPNTDGTSYNDVLPSANLVFDLGNDQVVRLGAARVMARANLNDMRASLGFGVDNGYTENGVLAPIIKGGAGNAKLNPFRANALDVAYEKYWGNKAYVSVAAFHKDIRSYIVKRNVAFDFAPYITASTPLPAVGKYAGSTIGLLDQPLNGEGGRISGYELAASLPFSMLWKPLDGFGIQASYASTSSSISLPTSGITGSDINTGSIPLPGLSKKVASFQLYFEKWGFQARFSQRYRSAFVGEITDGVGDRRLTYIKGETVTDAQLGYEFQSGYLKGLSVLLQGYNLNNTPYIRYRDTPSNEVENTKYGKTYLLGLSYKL